MIANKEICDKCPGEWVVSTEQKLDAKTTFINDQISNCYVKSGLMTQVPPNCPFMTEQVVCSNGEKVTAEPIRPEVRLKYSIVQDAKPNITFQMDGFMFELGKDDVK